MTTVYIWLLQTLWSSGLFFIFISVLDCFVMGFLGLAIWLCAFSLTLTLYHLVLPDFPQATLSTQVPEYKIHIWDWWLELLIPIFMTILISVRMVLLTGSSVLLCPPKISTPEHTPGGPATAQVHGQPTSRVPRLPSAANLTSYFWRLKNSISSS